MKALIALLVVGTSSVALAQPAQVAPTYPQYDYRYDEFPTNNVVVRDHRYAQPPPPARPPSYEYGFDDGRFDGRFDGQHRFDQRMRLRRPVLLAHNVSIDAQWNHGQQGPKLVEFDARTRGLKKLRIDRAGGRMYLDTVVIHFADGHHQTVRPHVMLSKRQPSTSIDLEHGDVLSMYIYATPMRGRATVDVIGLRR